MHSENSYTQEVLPLASTGMEGVGAFLNRLTGIPSFYEALFAGCRHQSTTSLLLSQSIDFQEGRELPEVIPPPNPPS